MKKYNATTGDIEEDGRSFEEFAKNHDYHKHCIACGTCLLNPDPIIQTSYPLWCNPCATNLEQNSVSKLPWDTTGGFRL